jgi:hypothetical protein
MVAMKTDRISLPVKEFLIIEQCPSELERFDLYRFYEPSTDESGAIFYVGQSENAFRRVRRHVEHGFKGRSLVGKSIRVNWPRSMNLVLELLDSRAFDSAYKEKDDPASHRTAVERHLIETLHPCFNSTWNPQPTPVPPGYRPPDADVPYPRHMGRMLREAKVATERALRDQASDTEW